MKRVKLLQMLTQVTDTGTEQCLMSTSHHTVPKLLCDGPQLGRNKQTQVEGKKLQYSIEKLHC
jgi:hypothetical protein